METTATIINLSVGVLALTFLLYIIKRLITDHFEDRRRQRGLELARDLQHLAIDEKISEKECMHLLTTLSVPTPAALALVEDRLAELEG